MSERAKIYRLYPVFCSLKPGVECPRACNNYQDSGESFDSLSERLQIPPTVLIKRFRPGTFGSRKAEMELLKRGAAKTFQEHGNLEGCANYNDPEVQKVVKRIEEG